MTLSLSVIVDGVEHSLSDGSLTTFMSEDGLGMPSIVRFHERGPLQRGSTDRGFSYKERIASYVLGISASGSELADRRQNLVRIFRPTRSLIMRHVLDNGDDRRLDCVFFSGLDMPANDREVGRFQKARITIKADDPTYYDPVAKAITFQLGGGIGAWVFPWEIPWGIGASSINQSIAINYDGDIAAYPTLIRITGPITDAVITNESTNEKLDFTGVTIAAGDYYDIDLRYGMKTIVDANGDDKFDDLSVDSDHATWHLAADDEVYGGVNAINVSGNAITALSKIEISYLDRYSAI